MTCFVHPEAQATAFCRTCGKALCEECKQPAQGTVFCAEHAPVTAPPPEAPRAAAAKPNFDPSVSPGLAAFLGFIPGVGAIYNGQYAKGLVHAIIFGLLVSIVSSRAAPGLEPLFGMFITAWVFYMVFEAYHTARKRMLGEPVDEFSSLINMRAGSGRFPAGAVVLIVLGVILLLNTMDILDFRYIVRYWPVVLILIGVYMLWGRLAQSEPAASDREARHERS
jgi:cell wall-active antibiotic response 4TMS protein YvqF/B-box zinc finger protein